MKTLLFFISISLMTPLQVMAVAPSEPAQPIRFELFDIIDLSDSGTKNVAAGCGTKSRAETDHNNTSENNVLFSIMLAARESGVEVELVEEDICLN